MSAVIITNPTPLHNTSPSISLGKFVRVLLAADEDVKEATRVKAFVNVTLKEAALFRDTLADTDKIFKEGFLPEEKG